MNASLNRQKMLVLWLQKLNIVVILPQLCESFMCVTITIRTKYCINLVQLYKLNDCLPYVYSYNNEDIMGF